MPGNGGFSLDNLDKMESLRHSVANGMRTNRRTFICRSMQWIALSSGALHAKELFGQEKQSRAIATLKISDHPVLEKIGGFVLLEDTPAGELLIVRTAENGFASLSNVCPHRQCHVRVISPSLIRCPCHQSAYKIDGSYISGPSKASLKKFGTRIEGDIITALEN
jgi:Rieske Fe-S protein